MRRDLRSDFVLSKRLPIELVSEERLTVGFVFFFRLLRRLPVGLASERRITVGLVLFSFYYFDDQLDLPVKETDNMLRSKSPLVARRKRALKKKFCYSNPMRS